MSNVTIVVEDEPPGGAHSSALSGRAADSTAAATAARFRQDHHLPRPSRTALRGRPDRRDELDPARGPARGRTTSGSATNGSSSSTGTSATAIVVPLEDAAQGSSASGRGWTLPTPPCSWLTGRPRERIPKRSWLRARPQMPARARACARTAATSRRLRRRTSAGITSRGQARKQVAARLALELVIDCRLLRGPPKRADGSSAREVCSRRCRHRPSTACSRTSAPVPLSTRHMIRRRRCLRCRRSCDRPHARVRRRRDSVARAGGLALVSDGAVEEGMRRLDEATAAAVSGKIERPS